MRDLLDPLDLCNVIDVLKRGRQTRMHTENFAIDSSRQRQIIKQVGELLPDDKAAILFLAFNLKAVDLSDLARFMIASQQVEPVRVAQFKQYQVRDCLYRRRSPVDIITQEEVVCVGHLATNPKQLDDIEELPMHVAHNRHWGLHRADILLS